MARIESLSSTHATATLAYLSRSPYEHVFLSYIVREGTPAMQRGIRTSFDSTGNVNGVAYFGHQIVLASEEAALAGFAQMAKRYPGEHAIVGPRATVMAYWELICSDHTPPRLVRDRQYLMAIDGSSLLHPSSDMVLARRARDEEWEAVAKNSAAMIANELETDGDFGISDFNANIRQMIRLGLWWVGERAGQLCFFCNVGPWSPQTAQLQGIWTPPELRGQGLATAALGSICSLLLQHVPTLSLYVNDFNAPAIALYEKLGFYRVGELQTILF